MSDTPETDAQLWPENKGARWMHLVPADFARRLERERDEARRFAEAYRHVWEMCSAAVEITPNPDPLPWKRK